MFLKKKIRYLRRFKCLFPSFTRKKIKKRKNKPGEHPFFYAKRTSVKQSFINRLTDKQKLKLIFCITEKQLKNYILFVLMNFKNEPFLGLYNLLHSRLDFLVYKLHFANTVLQARQFINHGHICVNSKKISRPGYKCRIGDEISTRFKLALNNVMQHVIGRVFNTANNKNYSEFAIKIPKPQFVDLEIIRLIKSSFEFYL